MNPPSSYPLSNLPEIWSISLWKYNKQLFTVGCSPICKVYLLNLHRLLYWEVHRYGFTVLTFFWLNLLAYFLQNQKISRKIHSCMLLGKASHLTASCPWDTSLTVILACSQWRPGIGWEYVLYSSGWLCITSWPNNLKQIEAWKYSQLRAWVRG